MLNISSRRFATHVKVAVMGAGTGGISATAQMMRSGRYNSGDIAIFDPSEEHIYQPSLTMIGGSVIGDDEYKVKKQEYKYLKRPMKELIYDGVTWHQTPITKLSPETNSFSTPKGDYTYDVLIVTPGIKLDLD